MAPYPVKEVREVIEYRGYTLYAGIDTSFEVIYRAEILQPDNTYLGATRGKSLENAIEKAKKEVDTHEAFIKNYLYIKVCRIEEERRIKDLS